MVSRKIFLLTVSALMFGCAAKPHPEAQQPPKVHPPGEIVAAARIRDALPIRLGFVGNLGIGDNSPAEERSAELGIKIGPNNLNWVATHLDLLALDARCIDPDRGDTAGTFKQIRQVQRLFTGLLKVDASSLYEQEDYPGNVGGWKSEMEKWTLRDTNGVEVKHPDAGGHWMDFGNTDWAAHWFKRVHALANRYSASGVLATQLPPGNTFVTAQLQKYPRFSDDKHRLESCVDATSQWLAVVHHPDQLLLVVSGVGFDGTSGRPTLPVAKKRYERELSGRGWDEFDSLIDGAWAEGWVRPYWIDATVSEKEWEIQVEAAERAAINDNVFIASAAYHNADELEFDLASYLLAAHRQGRLCFQPMPILPGQSNTSGFSLAVLKSEYNKYQSYFDVALGFPTQERHEIILQHNTANQKGQEIVLVGNSVWRRAFDKGVVYVNSHDQGTVAVPLGGEMIALSGEVVRGVNLGPHSGVILLYPPKVADAKATKRP